MLNQKKAKEMLDYCKETGKLFWSNSMRKQVRGKCLGIEKNGYYVAKIDNKKYLGHRLVWLIHYGSFPADTIDHINGDRLDNRIENLRVMSSLENNLIRHSYVLGKLAGTKQNVLTKKWLAKITIGKRTRYIGRFETEIEAYNAHKINSVAEKYQPVMCQKCKEWTFVGGLIESCCGDECAKEN